MKKKLSRETLRVGDILDDFEKDEVRKKTDIVMLFESFGVKLKQKGKSHIGLCPFHEDRNPSLSVDRTKGLYNCFGCGESGDVFSLVEKMKGYSFPEAMKYLKEMSGVEPKLTRASELFTSEPQGSEPFPIAAETASEEGGSIDEFERTKLLTEVTEYYHRKLYENDEALSYLAERGLIDTVVYDRFGIGFSDGSLLERIGEDKKKELIKIGILKESESSGKIYEHFRNCIVFPIVDEMENVVGLYGRSINPDAKVPHLYLPGKHRGVFNRKASKVFDEIILTECVIDCLSLVEAGIENVQSVYGVNGFTDEHLEILKEDRVKRIVIAFDADEAGRNAAERLRERLIGEGFEVGIVTPPRAKDWNEYLCGKGEIEELKELFQAAWPSSSTLRPGKAAFTSDEVAGKDSLFDSPSTPQEASSLETAPVKAEKDTIGYTFTIGEIVYRVSGVKDVFIGNLRVNIKAEHGGEKYFDSLDLYSARGRNTFSGSLAKAFGIEPKHAEKDLIAILEHLERERDKNILFPNREEKKELSKEDVELGMTFLKNPGMFDEIVKDMETHGYVGEDLNKKLLYIAASSRKLDDPMSVLILSQSASGKSLLVETVRKLIPPEETIAVTSLSDQALNYVSDLKHKFLILGEAVHSDVIEHQIREMLSGKELSRLVTMKDEKLGKMISREVKTPAIVSAVMSGTSHKINPENASRCFVVNADETREQTRRIHEAQREKYTLEKYRVKKTLVPEITRKHHIAQRLLRRLDIVNPFAIHLNFPDSLMRSRRDHDRFMDLIACVCFLRQYQKEVKKDGDIEYIECDLEDYKEAYEIMVNGVLSSTMTEMPKGAMILYDSVLEIARKSAKKKGLKITEITLTQRDIREGTSYSHSWIKQNMRILVDFEYLFIVRGGEQRAKGHYRVKADEPIRNFDLSMIPAPEEMRLIIQRGELNKNA